MIYNIRGLKQSLVEAMTLQKTEIKQTSWYIQTIGVKIPHTLGVCPTQDTFRIGRARMNNQKYELNCGISR